MSTCPNLPGESLDHLNKKSPSKLANGHLNVFNQSTSSTVLQLSFRDMPFDKVTNKTVYKQVKKQQSNEDTKQI